MRYSANTPKLSETEIEERLRLLDGWSRAGNCIEKKYEFKSFLRAMLFVNAIAFVAESLNHHPDITVRYDEVTLRNWTHAAGGITEYDFTLAEKIDSLIESREGSSLGLQTTVRSS